MAIKGSILYVEDEVALGQIVKEGLEAEKWDVHWVQNGSDVADRLATSKFDICLLDVMLPGKDGFTVGKEMAKTNPQLPVIFLTARSEVDDVVKGFESGGQDYMRKPFSLKELLVRIDNILNRPKTQTASNLYKFGAYTFNTQNHELQHSKEDNTLSHKEAQLLSILVKAENTVIDRKEILMAIWEDDSFFHSRRLDVYVRKLREYLKHDDSVNIITLRGMGYRFVTNK